MEEKPAGSFEGKAALKIFLLTFAANGLMFLCDGHYMDDWEMYFSFFTGNSIFQKDFFSDCGQIYLYYYHEFIFSHFQKEYIFIVYRVLVFFSIFLSNLMLYKILDTTRLLSNFEKMFIVLIFACFMTQKTFVYFIDSTYIICYGLFLTASYLAIKNIEKRSLAITLISVILFTISYITGSFYVYHYGFLLAYFYLSNVKKETSNPERGNLVLSGVYFFLPIIVFFSNKFIFPKRGLNTSYNNVDPTNKTLHLFNRFFDSVTADIINPLYNYVSKPSVFLIMIAVFSLVFLVCRRKFSISSEKGAILLEYGFILLLLGILPYAFIGGSPSTYDINPSRYTMLLSLPVAIMLVAIVKIVHETKRKPVKYVSFIVLSLMVFAFFMARNQNYISMEARWIKDQSIILNLRDNKEAMNYKFFWIKDRYKLGGVRSYWGFREWKGMFYASWNDLRWIGINIEPDSNFLTAFELLKKDKLLPPTSEQAIIEIDKKQQTGETKIVMKYWFLKLFRKNELADYVKNIVTLNLDTKAGDIDEILMEENILFKRFKDKTYF